VTWAAADGAAEHGLVGRDREVAHLAAFAARPDAEAIVLVVEGEAGIGKSMLWRAGVEAARAAHLDVRTSRPAQGETGFSR